jgi:hypothetical protein
MCAMRILINYLRRLEERIKNRILFILKRIMRGMWNKNENHKVDTKRLNYMQQIVSLAVCEFSGKRRWKRGRKWKPWAWLLTPFLHSVWHKNMTYTQNEKFYWFSDNPKANKYQNERTCCYWIRVLSCWNNNITFEMNSCRWKSFNLCHSLHPLSSIVHAHSKVFLHQQELIFICFHSSTFAHTSHIIALV